MIIIGIYIFITVLIAFLQRFRFGQGIFKTVKKTSWIVSGLSLLMYYISVEQGQVLSGIIEEKGLWGLWIFWPSILGAAVIPVVFAPLWQKLDFITDNQFILFRFSGKSARFLHQFRSLYVGGIVVSFLLSFHVLAFGRVVETWYSIPQQQAVTVVGIVLTIFALKNSFNVKIKVDGFHALLYLIGIGIAFYFVFHASDGWSAAVSHLESTGKGKLDLFPPTALKDEWGLFFVFLGVQWWSSQLFDGGGPEMARFTATKGPLSAMKAALFPIIIYSLLSLAMLVMVVLCLSLQSTVGHEAGFIEVIHAVVPDWIKPLCLIGFFAMFISTAESLMNWGASFLTIDFYKTYLSPTKSERHYSFVSFGSMALLSLFAVVIALNSASLKQMILIVFSISAGVAPVYVLRWFWLRINAWSQITAMIASSLCTLTFHVLHELFPGQLKFNFLNEFSVQVLTSTLFTTIAWLTVTFLTPKDEESVLYNFSRILPPKSEVIKRFGLAFTVGIVLLLLNLVALSLLIS
jgi:SSS family solute:Na+ symporter